MTRALNHLATGAIPGYLGPIISVCYWQGQQWETLSNPTPGNHPVPERPAWCEVPVEGDQSAQIREVNARRYLLAEHLDAYARITEQQDPDLWLSTQLALADTWGWQAPEQLEFFLVQSLGDALALSLTIKRSFELSKGSHDRQHQVGHGRVLAGKRQALL